MNERTEQPGSAAPAAPARSRKNAKLFDALAEVGVTEDDYAQVQKARRIIDAVNARLAARGAAVMYAVTCNPTGRMPGKVVQVQSPLDIFAEAEIT